jgi:hypothetical protein
MSLPPRNRRSSAASIVAGIFKIARGRPDGLKAFSGTRQAFLASLAPLLAFPIVGAGMLLAGGGGLQVIADLLATICALLAPPVLSFEVARLWGREAAWLRFATAFNWCQWILPVAMSLLLLALGMAMAVGLSQRTASMIVVLALGCYALWLHWFLARHGLGLPGGRSALLVLGVNLGTVCLVLVPRLVGMDRG